jgi:hypothetical protein
MKTLKLIAALTVLTASSAFAADAPKTDAQAEAKPVLLASAAAPAAVATAAAGVAAPAAQIQKDGGRSRAEVQREAAEAVRTYENTLSRDLSFYTK